MDPHGRSDRTAEAPSEYAQGWQQAQDDIAAGRRSQVWSHHPIFALRDGERVSNGSDWDQGYCAGQPTGPTCNVWD